MSIAEGILNINCQNCNNTNKILSEDSDFEVIGGGEGQMGVENQYSWESNFVCSHCDNEIQIEYEVWEYPEGSYNFEDLKIHGGKSQDKFTFNFNSAPDNFEEIIYSN